METVPGSEAEAVADYLYNNFNLGPRQGNFHMVRR